MNNEQKKGEWIRLASKSRAGRFYLFNKATGETQWLPLKPEAAREQKIIASPPKLSLQIAGKTPAQDRLKRLQHNLKIGHAKAHSYQHTPHHSNDLKSKLSKPLKEQENKLEEEPSTSSRAASVAKSLKKATKRSLSPSLPNEIDHSIRCSKSLVLDNPKKLRISESLTSTETSQTSKETTTNKIFESLQNTEDHSSTFKMFRSGIVKKIQEICKIPFNISKKLSDEKVFRKNENSSSVINTTKFKPTRKVKAKQNLSILETSDAIINHIREENRTLTNSSDLTTPKPPKYPSYPRGSANTRLERLKSSLISQQHEQYHPCNATNNSDTLNQVSHLPTKTNYNKTTSLQIADSHNTTPNNSRNSSYNTANDTINTVEAMDWQPIARTEGSSENSSSEPAFVVEKSKKFVLKGVRANGDQTIGDIIDTVNKNLLRFSAEKQKISANNDKKWHKDFYYFIVDTNVLLRDLTFVEDLSKMKLCDTKGSILYIPYSVLQELDKLKMRSGFQEGVKTLAVRAIKYLNSKFENSSPHIQAQSAMDEREHMVDINSADDSIINCCLQAKEHVPNLLLLTEDVNLRNKAICNNIMVSTKSDLVSKRYNSSAKP